MEKDQVYRLLNECGRATILGDAYLKQKVEQGENYYKLKETTNAKWDFVLVQRERQYDERVVKTFNKEEDGVRYYYLFELNNHFFYSYVYPFEKENKNLNIGEENCTIENIKEAFNRLAIPESYYSFNDEIKEHTIVLKNINKNESAVLFIGKNNQEIFKTPKLDKWLAYYAMYKFVYYLYLFDQHIHILISKNEIDEFFSDDDFNVVVS